MTAKLSGKRGPLAAVCKSGATSKAKKGNTNTVVSNRLDKRNIAMCVPVVATKVRMCTLSMRRAPGQPSMLKKGMARKHLKLDTS